MSRADEMFGPRPHRNTGGRWMNWHINRGRITPDSGEAAWQQYSRRISWRRVL